MAAPTVYASTDASAPAITGEHGSLVAALKAILVNGYGAKAAAGWTCPYTSGTDYACFRQAAGSNGHYFAVNDTDTRMARITGFDSMSDATSGTNSFGHSPGGFYIRKSIAETSVARHWLCFATNRTLYLFIFAAQPASGPLNTFSEGIGGVTHFAFGQSAGSRIPGDIYNTFAIGSYDSNTTSTTASTSREVLNSYSIAGNAPGHYMARNRSFEPNVALRKAMTSLYQPSSSMLGLGTDTHPSRTGALWMSKSHLFSIYDSNYRYRGTTPGLWAIVNATISDLGQLQELNGNSETLNGKTFVVVLSGAGGVAVEKTAWDE